MIGLLQGTSGEWGASTSGRALPERLPPLAGRMREIFCERRDIPLIGGARRGSVSFRLAGANTAEGGHEKPPAHG